LQNTTAISHSENLIQTLQEQIQSATGEEKEKLIEELKDQKSEKTKLEGEQTELQDQLQGDENFLSSYDEEMQNLQNEIEEHEAGMFPEDPEVFFETSSGANPNTTPSLPNSEVYLQAIVKDNDNKLCLRIITGLPAITILSQPTDAVPPNQTGIYVTGAEVDIIEIYALKIFFIGGLQYSYPGKTLKLYARHIAVVGVDGNEDSGTVSTISMTPPPAPSSTAPIPLAPPQAPNGQGYNSNNVGNNGSPGVVGKTGATGAPGGNSGNLFIFTQSVTSLVGNFKFVLTGGVGGVGGIGGPGGQGGNGAQGRGGVRHKTVDPYHIDGNPGGNGGNGGPGKC
jgi:hypothetical protein